MVPRESLIRTPAHPSVSSFSATVEMASHFVTLSTSDLTSGSSNCATSFDCASAPTPTVAVITRAIVATIGTSRSVVCKYFPGNDFLKCIYVSFLLFVALLKRDRRAIRAGRD